MSTSSRMAWPKDSRPSSTEWTTSTGLFRSDKSISTPRHPRPKSRGFYAWCPAKLASVHGRNGLQVWLSEDQERYHKYVSSLGTVRMRDR